MSLIGEKIGKIRLELLSKNSFLITATEYNLRQARERGFKFRLNRGETLEDLCLVFSTKNPVDNQHQGERYMGIRVFYKIGY